MIDNSIFQDSLLQVFVRELNITIWLVFKYEHFSVPLFVSICYLNVKLQITSFVNTNLHNHHWKFF